MKQDMDPVANYTSPGGNTDNPPEQKPMPEKQTSDGVAETDGDAPQAGVLGSEVAASTALRTSSLAAAAEPPCTTAAPLGEAKREKKEGDIDLSFLKGDREVTDKERFLLKTSMTQTFRNKYLAIRAELAEAMAKQADKKDKVDVLSALQTAQYDTGSGLKIKGGHRPMKRPEGTKLPSDFRTEVGILTMEEMLAYSSDNADGRFLVSVYGSIFDVSDRPDKYGPDGPYYELTGKDITWGLFTGNDSAENCNRCFDLFKGTGLGEETLQRKLAGLCSWLAWYELEYGVPVGFLDVYIEEKELPAPPIDEINDCTIM
eukprot:TRINITY_DN5552_c0_g1_i3.p1 TRINITY_DN5552_c0_g1~~TRINITY_DN5552_c0_g1_i3.p1  ORF type:complete len:316 (-),score=75.31 TRINITY_DN5552_c0_g1_i3:156-1103(-)